MKGVQEENGCGLRVKFTRSVRGEGGGGGSSNGLLPRTYHFFHISPASKNFLKNRSRYLEEQLYWVALSIDLNDLSVIINSERPLPGKTEIILTPY